MPLDLLDATVGKSSRTLAPTMRDMRQPQKDDIEDEDIFGDEQGVSDFAESDDQQGYGTATLVDAMTKLMQNPHPPVFDIILVNVDTIIRNNTTLDRSNEEILEKTKVDITELNGIFTSYMEMQSTLTEMPTIVFYFPSYVTIPALHIRKDSPTRKKIKEVSALIKKKDNLFVRKTIRDRDGNIDIYEILAGDEKASAPKALETFIRDLTRINPLGLVSSQKKYLVITHNPVDFHLSRIFTHWTLLESFTGKFYKPEDLGLKVFKSKYVPFNSVTHMLFGDDVQIYPMAKRKNRKYLMDMAMRSSWKIRTKKQIADEVGLTGQVPKDILLTPIFGI